LNVRHAKESDTPALGRLNQQVQTLHSEAHPEVFLAVLDKEAAGSFFDQLRSDPRNLLLVADISGEIVGYIWCEERIGKQGVHLKASHSGYIHHISVDPDHQRRGIGKALVDRAVRELGARGVKSIKVDYWSFNERARTFFLNVGFAPVGEIASKPLSDRTRDPNYGVRTRTRSRSLGP
jgi:ribosomal protein S18 acetylase RimI-like enzyme